MLRIPIDRLVLTENAVNDAGRFFGINLSLLSEVDASYPLVFDLLEWWFDFHDAGEFIYEIPEDLIFPIKIRIFGCLAEVIQTFELTVGLLKFYILLALSVVLVLFLLGFRV